MGCDIHTNIEVVKKDKAYRIWENINDASFVFGLDNDARYEDPKNLYWTFNRRNYMRFAMLANVRDDFGFTENDVHLATPIDINEVNATWLSIMQSMANNSKKQSRNKKPYTIMAHSTLLDALEWKFDGHSYARISLAELKAVIMKLPDYTTYGNMPSEMANALFPWIEALNSIKFEYNLRMKNDDLTIDDDEIQVVFWFDN